MAEQVQGMKLKQGKGLNGAEQLLTAQHHLV